jgi:hypothetical protein
LWGCTGLVVARRPALTLAEVLFFCLSPAGIKQIKKQKGTAVARSGWQARGGKCKWGRAVAKYALYSDAYLPVPIFLGSGDPLTLISVQRMF